MNLDKLMNGLLMNEFEGGGGGGGGSNAAALYSDDSGHENYDAGTSDDPSKTEFKEQSGGAEQGGRAQTSETTTPAGPVDYEKLATSIASAMGKTFQPPVAEQKRSSMSVDEFRKATKYYQVTPQDVKEAFGDLGEDQKAYESRAAVLQRIADGQAEHSITVARELMNMQLQDRLAPYEQMRQQQVQERVDSWVGSICKKYEGLGKAQPLVHLAIKTLRDNKYVPQNEEADTKAVLSVVQTFMSAAGGNFQIQQAGNKGGGRPASRGNMPGAVNGAGGSGHANGDTRKQSNAARLYGAK